jgi:hypothetical protein
MLAPAKPYPDVAPASGAASLVLQITRESAPVTRPIDNYNQGVRNWSYTPIGKVCAGQKVNL